MSQLAIADLNFFETVCSEHINGGVGIVPDPSVALDVALDSRLLAGQSIGGTLGSGFSLNILTLGSAASAAAASTSLFGIASAKAFAKA